MTEQPERPDQRGLGEREPECRIAAAGCDLVEQVIDPASDDVRVGRGVVVDTERREKAARVDLETTEAVGVASYLRIDPVAGSIEVGHINYSPKLQRTVAATEAMYLMMRRAFELGYRRYEWKCDSLNAPSRAAAQRYGFSFEGTFRQAWVYKGRSRDSAWFSIIDTEWPALREAFERWLAPENFDAAGQQRVSLASLTAPLLKTRYPAPA